MRRIAQGIACAAVMVLAFGAPAFPQSASLANVKLQFTISKNEGGKKVSMPYTIVTGIGETASLRLGHEAPMAGPATPLPTQTPVTLQHFGTAVDCRVTITDEGRYKVEFTVSRRFLSTEGQPRSLIVARTTTLKDGESTQFAESSIDEPQSKPTGEVFTLDIVLTVLK